MIGFVDIKRNQQGDEYLTYKFYKAPCLKQGYSIKSGLVDEGCLLLGGEDGSVYKFAI